MSHTQSIEVALPGRTIPTIYTDFMPEGGAEVDAISFHGWGCSDLDMLPTAEALTERGIRLVTYLEDTTARLTMDDRVLVARGVAAACGISGNSHAVVGHSQGGGDAALYASRYEEVNGLLSIAGNHHRSDRYLTGLVDAIDKDDFAHTSEFWMYVAALRRSSDSGVSKTYADRVSSFSVAERIAYHYAAVDSLDHVRGGKSELPLLTDFSRGPRAFMHGEHEQADYLGVLHAAGVSIITIPEASHFINLDNPAAYVSEIGNFLLHVRDESTL